MDVKDKNFVNKVILVLFKIDVLYIIIVSDLNSKIMVLLKVYEMEIVLIGIEFWILFFILVVVDILYFNIVLIIIILYEGELEYLVIIFCGSYNGWDFIKS